MSLEKGVLQQAQGTIAFPLDHLPGFEIRRYWRIKNKAQSRQKTEFPGPRE